MAHDARITWKRRGASRPEALPVPVLAAASRDTWRSIRVEEARYPCAGELPEGAVQSHLLVVNAGPAFRVAPWWPGEPAADGMLPPGGFNFFPAATPFAVRWMGPASSIMVEIAPRIVADLTDPGDSGEPARLRQVAHGQDPVVTHLALALRDLAASGHPGGAAYGEALGVALAEHVVRRYARGSAPPRPSRGTLPGRLQRRVAEYVEAHLARDIPLHDLAGLAELSVFHFARLFKRSTGISPHQFILRRRIERARALLSDPGLSVSDVAARAGFAHHSHFTDTFHRLVGMTPTQYRRAT